MTIMGFPPAGGWVTLNNIINPTPKPTAKGIVKYKGKGIKYSDEHIVRKEGKKK